ncbi:hypothetical protein E5288_WYG002531 [Bos mutus]|uniref:Uncharacterized protein n=1 Tax=Bos mutus TaxID=72004 RepID=A0A6B0R2I9_9CETA|nr:hypothetical protein [Bos mutus]
MLRRRDERHGLAYRRLRWTRLQPERRRDRRAQTRGLGPPLLAAGPRSAFSAHSGPPLGRFRFRFLAESVEENESGSVQSLRGSRRGEGRTVRGGQPGAGEPEPQPAPGEAGLEDLGEPRTNVPRIRQPEVEMAVGPGLPCTAGSDEAGQQRNKKMDSLLLKPRMAATSHGLTLVEEKKVGGGPKCAAPRAPGYLFYVLIVPSKPCNSDNSSLLLVPVCSLLKENNIKIPEDQLHTTTQLPRSMKSAFSEKPDTQFPPPDPHLRTQMAWPTYFAPEL